MKIIIPGGAGLVGQNLVKRLKDRGYRDITVIDKHPANTSVLKEMHPDIKVLEADLAQVGRWAKSFESGDVVVMLQAQIGSKCQETFWYNNVDSTRNILDAMKLSDIHNLIHISSAVVGSVADDEYTRTKKEQENIVAKSGIDYVILRPTLMFGWFDRKHFGWLSRFMRKVPVFPIPGHGRYMRQPLYVRDFCDIIISSIEKKPSEQVYNITGRKRVYYIEIIRTIREVTGAKTYILKIPYGLFKFLLCIWALFDPEPPFTVSQLEALVAGDEFELIPWPEIFGVKETPFDDAIRETFTDPVYSKCELQF